MFKRRGMSLIKCVKTIRLVGIMHGVYFYSTLNHHCSCTNFCYFLYLHLKAFTTCIWQVKVFFPSLLAAKIAQGSSDLPTHHSSQICHV